jgi:hypothetical protein
MRSDHSPHGSPIGSRAGRYIQQTTGYRAFIPNLVANCVPERLLDDGPPDYDAFLAERRKLMALKIKQWFEALS